MIKINLALKKQSGLTQSSGIKLSNRFKSLNFDQVQELPIRKLAVPLIAGFLASQTLDSFQAAELTEVGKSVAQVNSESEKIQKEMANYSKYDAVQKQVEGDLKDVGLKLDTIRKLFSERKKSIEIMTLFAQVVPKEVWLSKLKVDSGSVVLSGSSLGFSQVSDFIKSLNESSVLTGVELGSSHQDQGSNEGDVTHFDLRSKGTNNK